MKQLNSFQKSFRYLMILLLLFVALGCNVSKTDEEGNELSKEQLEATSKAKEKERLETEVDTEALKENESALLRLCNTPIGLWQKLKKCRVI